MDLVSPLDYRDYLACHCNVSIGNSEIMLRKNWNISRYGPEHYQFEEWTVWSFPDRGNWATHAGDYPGNWSPFIPRILLDRYTKVGEKVCDPMVGSGTTLVESRLMGRNAIGVDLNPKACMIAMNRLDFDFSQPRQITSPRIDVYCGDARNLDAVSGESVELVVIHPPYAGLIRYSEGNPDDLSQLGIKEFVREIGIVAKECLRVLKQNRHCAVLVGDTRIRGHYVPLNIGILSAFLAAGFVLREDIIKIQHQTRSARERWTGRSYGFYKIAHEHLYVLRKPVSGEHMADFEYSLRWW
jgi:DNA modification methylase